MNQTQYPRRHPVLFVVFLELTILGVLILTGAITQSLGMSDFVLYGVGSFLLVVIGVYFLTRVKWWKKVGFRSFKDRRHILLLWLPALPVLVALFRGNFNTLNLSNVATVFAITLLAGFMEEIYFRGMMLQALLSRGASRAAIITSVICSLTHGLNFLADWNPQLVFLQLGYSLTIGFGWAAFVIRTGVLWPLVLIHFLNNFIGLIDADQIARTGTPTPLDTAIDIVLTVAFAVYGVCLLRSHTKAQRLVIEK